MFLISAPRCVADGFCKVAYLVRQTPVNRSFIEITLLLRRFTATVDHRFIDWKLSDVSDDKASVFGGEHTDSSKSRH